MVTLETIRRTFEHVERADPQKPSSWHLEETARLLHMPVADLRARLLDIWTARG